MDSSSGKTHASHSGDPYDMQPKIILETLSPELPSRTKGVVYTNIFHLQTGLTVGHSFLLQIGGHFLPR